MHGRQAQVAVGKRLLRPVTRRAGLLARRAQLVDGDGHAVRPVRELLQQLGLGGVADAQLLL